MAILNNLKLLLFISSYIPISFHLVTSELSPDISPSPEPASAPSPRHASVPFPRSAPNAPINYISHPPSISGPPSESISPNADGPSAFDGLVNFDISPTTSSFDVSPGLKNICDATDYPSLCLATVTPHLNGEPDIPSVLQLSVKAGISFARHALTVAKHTAEKPENPDLAPILRDCMDFYNDVVYNFENALSAFPERDIGTISSMLSAVITDIGDCEDALKGTGAESPLSGYADKLTNMTSNCLAIASLMR